VILVIINGSLAFAIPTIILIINLNITTMFEIRKELVNAIGNIQRSEQICYVDCSKDDVIKHLAVPYYNLARAIRFIINLDDNLIKSDMYLYISLCLILLIQLILLRKSQASCCRS
jgi:hypothetical protein